MKKIIVLSLITSSLLFVGCSEEKNKNVIKNEDIKSVFNKPDSNKTKPVEPTKKDQNSSDFDKVKNSASAFGSAVGGYFSKKYSEASEASKVIYIDSKKYSEVKYDEAKKYYYDVSGKKEEAAKLEKKIKKIEKNIADKEMKKKQLFGNQLTKDKKDNLDFEIEEKKIKKEKSVLDKLKKDLDEMMAGVNKEKDAFNKINRPEKRTTVKDIKKKKESKEGAY